MARLKLSQQDAQSIGKGLLYHKEWFCQSEIEKDGVKQVCNARLSIRSDKDRDNEKSNFVGLYPPNFPDVRLRGHSVVPAGMLNWDGLAEERGWIVSPEIKCPACQAGLSREEFLKNKL